MTAATRSCNCFTHSSRAEEWSGEVIVATIEHHLEPGILLHGVGWIAAHIPVLGIDVVLEVPLSAAFKYVDFGQVGVRFTVLEHIAHIRSNHG